MDPSFEYNWYLVNRKRWGCPHYIFKWILLPIYVVVFIVYRILIANYNETGLVKKMTQTSMTTFPVVSAVICYLTWRSFPNFTTDRLFIREELKITIALYALFAITSGITSLFVWLDLISEFLQFLCFMIVLVLMLWVMIIYPRSKMKKCGLQISNKPVRRMHVADSSVTDWRTWTEIISLPDGYEYVIVPSLCIIG